MTDTWLDISTRIDARTVQILRAVATVAATTALPFMVVGAAARDMVLVHGLGLQVQRATRDIDLGVQVESWVAFESLRERLIQGGEFAPTGSPQRLQYRDGTPLDIVPFGGLAGADHRIRWPPNRTPIMSVLGFEDALQGAINVTLARKPRLTVPVVSPPGLVMLKLLAWLDRPADRKDAQDIGWILRCYMEPDTVRDRLYEHHADLLDVDDFDLVTAGARLLGRELAALASRPTREAVLNILHDQTRDRSDYRLVDAMADTIRQCDPFEENRRLLQALYTGVLDSSA